MADPDVNVPLWVNIAVPTLLGILFLAVLVLLFLTNKEIPIETLESWMQKIPLLSKYFAKTDNVTSDLQNVTSANQENDDDKNASHHRVKASMSKQNLLEYDSIMQDKQGINTDNTTSVNSHDNPAFHANQDIISCHL